MKRVFILLCTLAATLSAEAGIAGQASERPDRTSAAPTPAADPLEHVSRATALLIAGDLDKAIAEFDVAIELAPDSPQIHLLRAGAYGRKKQWTEARKDYEKVLSLDAENAGALAALALLEAEAGRLREAIDLLRRSLVKKDDNAVRTTLIRAYLAVKDYENAALELERHSERNPADTSTYALRIDTLVKAGRSADASAFVDSIVASSGGAAEGYMRASMLYRVAGLYDQAVAMADEGIRKSPTVNLYVERATAHRDPALQRADLEQALKILPGYPIALAMLIDVVLKQKDYKAAMQRLDEIERLRGYSPPYDFYRKRGDALEGLGDTVGAESAYVRAREKATDARQLNSLCWAKATAGKALLEAVKDCDAALALLPQCWNCHDSRGLVMLQLGRNEDAINSYSAALSGDPRIAESLFGRGIARLRLGFKTEGDSDIAAAVLLDPNVTELYRGFGITP